MARRSAIRASDAERDHVADRLRLAASEGRLMADELEIRLARALRAQTRGELGVLVADLPSQRPAGRRRPAVPTVAGAVAVGVVAVAALMVLALALLLLAGLMMAYGVWVILAWWCFGRGRRSGARQRYRAQVRYAPRRGLL